MRSILCQSIVLFASLRQSQRLQLERPVEGCTCICRHSVEVVVRSILCQSIVLFASLRQSQRLQLASPVGGYVWHLQAFSGGSGTQHTLSKYRVVRVASAVSKTSTRKASGGLCLHLQAFSGGSGTQHTLSKYRVVRVSSAVSKTSTR